MDTVDSPTDMDEFYSRIGSKHGLVTIVFVCDDPNSEEITLDIDEKVWNHFVRYCVYSNLDIEETFIKVITDYVHQCK